MSMGCVQPYATSPLGHLKSTRLFGFPMLHIWMAERFPMFQYNMWNSTHLYDCVLGSTYRKAHGFNGPTTALRKALVWCAGLAGGVGGFFP